MQDFFFFFLGCEEQCQGYFFRLVPTFELNQAGVMLPHRAFFKRLMLRFQSTFGFNGVAVL